MIERTAKIENFIGMYDNYILPEECQKAIDLFNNQTEMNKTFDRMQSDGSSILEKNDKQYFATEENINIWWERLKTLMVNFDVAWHHYMKTVGARMAYGQEKFFYTNVKIQKTLPTEGYHLWHLEHNKGFDNEPRAFVYAIYLNDVEDGGETEFLHFSKRVKPKTGRIVIWPAAFPYVHRGNPPLGEDKYIVTSWFLGT